MLWNTFLKDHFSENDMRTNEGTLKQSKKRQSAIVSKFYLKIEVFKVMQSE
jgi:hypothetical protein